MSGSPPASTRSASSHAMADEALAAFLLLAQSHLLESALDERADEASTKRVRKPRAKQQRQAITRCLRQIFVDLVGRLRPPLILEVGAHEASFSRIVKELQPQARVVAFEAHPLVYERYASAIELTGVEYVPFCVAAAEGEVVLRVPRSEDCEKRGKGSLLRNIKEAFSAEYVVRGVTLDGFLGDASQLANAMWIDVEGALAHVFAGAERTLGNCQAVYVEMECRARWEGQIIDADVITRLVDYGLKPVLRDVQVQGLQYNAIFLR